MKRKVKVSVACILLVLFMPCLRFWWVARGFPVELGTANGPDGYVAHLLAEPRYDHVLVTAVLMLLGTDDYPVHTYVEVRLSGFVLHTITVSHGGQRGVEHYKDAHMTWDRTRLRIKPRPSSSREICLDLHAEKAAPANDASGPTVEAEDSGQTAVL